MLICGAIITDYSSLVPNEYLFIKLISLISRSRPAFCRLQYGKMGRAWYLFSCEHDVIDKWQKKKIPNEKAKVSHILFNELEVQHLVCVTVTPR